jgi:hypothetical protein
MMSKDIPSFSNSFYVEKHEGPIYGAWDVIRRGPDPSDIDEIIAICFGEDEADMIAEALILLKRTEEVE